MKWPPALRACCRLEAPVLALGCMTFAGCFGVRGSGKPGSETRRLAPFHAVAVSGIVKVDATAGEAQSVTVSGDDNLVPRVITQVHDGELRIGTHEPVRPKLALVVHITAPNIAAASASGAAHLTLRGVDSSELRLDGVGAAAITASGSTGDLDLRLSGASTADTGKLEARAAHVTASGSGTAEVYASQLLQVRLSAAARVRYRGNPARVVKDISAAATLERR